MRFLAMGLLLTFLSAMLGATPPQVLRGSPAMQLGAIAPARPLPLWIGPTQVSSEMQLLLIDDQLANNQYITTLSSSGTVLPGGQQAAIFGARQRIGANRKSLTWYPHAVDKKIPVQQIYALQPDAAFEGVADRSGNRVSFNQGIAVLPSVNYVNLALSELAFARFTTVGLGSLNTLSYKEKLQDGSEREISATLAKAATLTLQRPESNICRPETVNGEQGQICTVRSVRVQQSAAVNGGDLRFTARAKGETPVSQFRVGQRWYRLGESIALAEFAASKAIEVFVQQETPLSLKIGNTLEMGFYSPSRLAIGDRFNLLMAAAGRSILPSEKESQLSRLELLVVDDQVENNQYLTTIGSSSQQSIYGVRRPQAFGGGSRPAAWYLGQDGLRMESLSKPVIYPPDVFSGFVDGKGQPADLGINPKLSDSAIDQLSKMALGDSVMFTHTTSTKEGNKQIRSHIVKGAQLTLSAPIGPSCRRETLANVAGDLCLLRIVESRFVAESGAGVQFRIHTLSNAPGAQLRVGSNWHPLNESIPLSEFVNSKGIEVFTPATSNGGSEITNYKMYFYSESKAVKGDRFLVNSLQSAAFGPTIEYVYSPSSISANDPGEPVLMVVGLTAKATKSTTLTVSTVPRTALAGIDYDPTKVEVYFDGLGPYMQVDLTRPKSMNLPQGIENITFKIPTFKKNKLTQADTIYFEFDGSMSGRFLYENGHIKASSNVSAKIVSISDSITDEGEPNMFSIKVENVSKDQSGFLKIKENTALLSDLDAGNTNITFLPSGKSERLDLNTSGSIIFPALTTSAEVSIPTKKQKILKDKNYSLSVNLGEKYDATTAKSGTATIKKSALPNIALSITPLAGEIAAGKIGAEDAKLAYKIKVDASNYTGLNMKKSLLARTLRAGSTMLVSVDGPVGQGNSCSFLIENSPQAGKHTLIPAYIEYAETTGPKKVFHGCRNERLDITAGQWNWQQDSSAQTLKGELDLTLGFVLSDSASLYTVEDPSLKWVGAARASGNITVRAEWNTPAAPLIAN